VPTAIQTDCSAWRVSTPKAAMQSAQRHRAAITSPSPQLDSTLESAWVARTASLSHMMSSTSTRCAKVVKHLRLHQLSIVQAMIPTLQMGRTQSVPTAIQTDCSAWRVSTPKAAMQSAQRHRAAITSPSPQLDSTLESAWVARTASLSHMPSSTSIRCAQDRHRHLLQHPCLIHPLRH